MVDSDFRPVGMDEILGFDSGDSEVTYLTWQPVNVRGIVSGWWCSLLQAVPDWAMGIFSLRFGGSEFKAPVASPANGHTDQAAEGTAAATCSGHETNGALHSLLRVA